MTGWGDDRDEMDLWRRNDLDEQLVDDLMAGRDVPPALRPVADGLAQVRSLAVGAPPQPAAALAALLAGAEPVPPGRSPDLLRVRRSRRAARATAVGAVAAVLALSSVGAAAAADRLPGEAQAFVAQVIERLTPFHVADNEQERVLPGPVVTSPSPSPGSPSTGLPAGVDSDAVRPPAPSPANDSTETGTDVERDHVDTTPERDTVVGPRPDASGDPEEAKPGTAEPAGPPSGEDASRPDQPSSVEDPAESDAGPEPNAGADQPVHTLTSDTPDSSDAEVAR